MMATASQALRSPNPLSHWLISWQEHERPSKAELDQAAEIFLDRLGLRHHQAIYAAHPDTHNVHLHIAVNRYDPGRERMLKVNKGFDLEAAHEAIAWIVHEQRRWQPEENARYRIENGKAVMNPTAAAAKAEGKKTSSASATAHEARSGLKSAQTICIKDAVPVMLQARSWAELHFGLAEKGIEYIPSRSGAVLKVGSEHVKASSAHRRCSHGKLIARLGEFKPRVRGLTVRERSLRDNLMPGAIRADELHLLRSTARAAREMNSRASAPIGTRSLPKPPG